MGINYANTKHPATTFRHPASPVFRRSVGNGGRVDYLLQKFMRLSKNGYLAQLYRWSYGTWRMPNNLCIYFWKLLFAIVVFPITWISYPFHFDHIVIRIIASLVCCFFLALFARLILGVFENPYFALEVLFYVGRIIAGFIVLIALVVLYALLEENPPEIVSETLKIIQAKKESVKDKFCPKIEWK